MQSSNGVINTAANNIISNPASALVASARPPIPLAPRLTTGSTSPSANSSEASTSTAHHSRPRQLIHRASQSTATQALNVDTYPPAARFSAYSPNPSRPRLYGSMGRNALGIGYRKNNTHFAYGMDESAMQHSRSKTTIDVAKNKGEMGDDTFQVLPQFRSGADFPGEVLVRCTGSDFYVHRAILYFASPFFQAVLDGDWKETHPSLYSLSDTEDIEGSVVSAEHDTVKDTASLKDKLESLKMPTSPRASFYTAHFAFDHPNESTDTASSPSSKSNDRADTVRKEGFDMIPEKSPSLESLGTQKDERRGSHEEGEISGRMRRLATPPPIDSLRDAVGNEAVRNTSAVAARPKSKRDKEGVVAVIDLREEEASTFQDFLCLVYPNLDLLVTWYNIFPLFAFSDKFEVPHLRRACTTFLRAALAGRPIEAMALGERHDLEDVYREASRHVLENMPSWDPEELEILSSETLLKLERKRTWFLERLLKLGLANPARDYECHAACPDPQNCARLLHERWRSQYANAFKYGPPQPSIIWRHLRELESGGSSTNTATIMSACQSSSKAWAQLLFDRMYGLPTHGTTVSKFLSIKLDPDTGPKPRPRQAQMDGDMNLPS